MAESKWVTEIPPAAPAADAARTVLTARLAVVRHYLPLAVAQATADTEHVHQLRVGTRRAGAALRAFAGCVPDKARRRLKRTLRAVRQAAGDARDWDVFAQTLAAAKPLAGAPARDFLLGYATGRRTAAQADLTRAAEEVGPAFAAAADALPDQIGPPADGPVTFGLLGAVQVGDFLRAFTAAVEADPPDPPGLHQLRILGKRVRYALEIFGGCLPPAYKAELYPAVEQVQGALGDVQDAAVAVARLTAVKAWATVAWPAEWERVGGAVDKLTRSLRGRIPNGRKAFQKWRANWLELAPVALD